MQTNKGNLFMALRHVHWTQGFIQQVDLGMKDNADLKRNAIMQNLNHAEEEILELMEINERI